MRAEKDSKVTSNVKVSAGWSVPIMPLEISFIQFYWGREKQTFLPLFNICRKSIAIDLQQVELELDQNCGSWVLEGKREGITIFHSSIMDITWIRSKFGHQMASLELPQLVSSLELVVNCRHHLLFANIGHQVAPNSIGYNFGYKMTFPLVANLATSWCHLPQLKIVTLMAPLQKFGHQVAFLALSHYPVGNIISEYWVGIFISQSQIS